ncbi:hypothetical protein FSP39_011362 [Pinctada imbricata]|uniref:Antistasin-like domain-containing protein n=1 Tax=Pinctada imbricata TaxID=66713 RepID=A0AA88XZ04_PINIB|nr:hypothetical protein FSP39_011362 [Pinctada imbricata]
MKHKRQHINQRDQWVTVADFRRPSGTQVAEAITTTPVSTTPLAVYLPNPCVQGQYVCEDGANCHDGFILGPNNCQYCMCAPNTTTVPLITPSKQHVDGHDGDASNTTDTAALPGHMKNECTIALAICSLKCKHGFMADTEDCKFCICKDEIYRNAGIEKGDEPTIQLMNPCVRGIDVCNIFCSHGYLRGPQNCQYCACGRVRILH